MMIKLRHLAGAVIFTAAFTLTAWVDDPAHYEADQWYITYQYEDGCNDWHNVEYDAYMFECDGVFYDSIDEYEALNGGRQTDHGRLIAALITKNKRNGDGLNDV